MNKVTAVLLFIVLSVSGLDGQVRTLDFYLSKGMAGSPLIRDFNNQLGSAGLDSMLVLAARKPFVEGRSVFQYIPVYGKFGYDEVVTDGGNYQAMAGVSQDIFRKKATNNKLQAVELNRKSIGNSTEITKNELTWLITSQYLASFSAYSDLNFNTEFLRLLDSENEIVKKLAAKGVYRQTDYLALLLETQTQEILVKRLKSDYESSVRQLNQLCGIDDSVSVILEIPLLKAPSAAGLASSAGYRQFAIDSMRIRNEITSIDLNYRPKISWFADAGFLTHDLTAFYNHFGYSAGLSLVVPIYDGNQRSLGKRKLDIEENTRSGYRDNFIVKYRQELLKLQGELEAQAEITRSLEKQLATAGSLLSAMKTELESGIIPMTDYISAIKNFRSINKALSDSRIMTQLLTGELNYIVNR